jgi:hypothetical protein
MYAPIIAALGDVERSVWDCSTSPPEANAPLEAVRWAAGPGPPVSPQPFGVITARPDSVPLRMRS